MRQEEREEKKQQELRRWKKSHPSYFSFIRLLFYTLLSGWSGGRFEASRACKMCVFFLLPVWQSKERVFFASRAICCYAFLCFLCFTFGRCLRLSLLTKDDVLNVWRAPNKLPLAVALSPPAPLPNIRGESSIVGSILLPWRLAGVSSPSREVHMPMFAISFAWLLLSVVWFVSWRCPVVTRSGLATLANPSCRSC